MIWLNLTTISKQTQLETLRYTFRRCFKGKDVRTFMIKCTDLVLVLICTSIEGLCVVFSVCTVRPAGWFDFSVVLHGFFIFSPYEKRKTRMNFA